jgi:P-type Ca2+ transporter type 2C
VTEELNLSEISGLSQQEADRRLAKEGLNELPSSKPRTVFAIAFEVVKEPMFLLLVLVGGLYLILGDVREALMLLSFVFVIMGITFYQERRTERVLEALRDLSSPRAHVIRDGQEMRIAGREVVRGDIMMLAEGDRVPADAVMLSVNNLMVDESLLTGESISVQKIAGSTDAKLLRPGGDQLPFVYSGTLVVQGKGLAQVLATGEHAELGKIGKALETVDSEPTRLQKETGRLVRNLALAGATLCAVVIVVYGLTRNDWLHGILAGLTLAMAMLPEEFPVVLTIFLALGAWRISQKRVLTRRVPAIETLGAATVFCVDKTGTLTKNVMQVERLGAGGEFYSVTDSGDELPETFHELIEYSILSSHRDPFDPMEKAIKEMGEKFLAKTEHLHDDWNLERQYPLSQKLLAISRVWASPGRTEHVIAAKGAPEAIADLCHMSAAEIKELDERIQKMARDGLRILGVAKANYKGPGFPGEQHDFDFKFIGLIGLADPVREGVPEAIKECYGAGIRIIMITGDYPGTAQYIGREIGLKNPDDFITGDKLADMSDEQLARDIAHVSIFARVVPEQKLRLVKALKANQETVAMTGDGVNDAPALKAANIGLAMGGRGTDVAREAAALVLLDDDFASIVAAVKLGRRIYDNLKKAMAYIFAVHVPIAGLSLIPVLLKWPLILLPVHIVFMELIIDPACSIVFEAEKEEADVMTRPPRHPDTLLFGRKTLSMSVLQGSFALAASLGIFAYANGVWHNVDTARTMAFVTLIIANLGLILANRSWSRTIWKTMRTPNAALWWVIGGAIVFLGIALYVPFMQKVFHFSPMSVWQLGISFSAGFISILWFELIKLGRRWAGSRDQVPGQSI